MEWMPASKVASPRWVDVNRVELRRIAERAISSGVAGVELPPARMLVNVR
jgi:hypothetical protein